MTGKVQPRDVVTLSDLLINTMRLAGAHDWRVSAGGLEWDVQQTLEHLAGSLGKYALYLASGVSRYIPMKLEKMAVEATHEDWLQALAACATAFEAVAAAAPDGARAFHAAGMADVEGYVALACAHLIEHGHDIVGGLGIEFDPPASICAAVNARLAPWAPTTGDPVGTFLWLVGKSDLPGHARVASSLPPVLAPLVEWDGMVPRPPGFPVAAYVFEPETRRWTPVRDVPDGPA